MKKIISGLGLATLLASCGVVQEELGTFEEELAKEQQTYVAALEKSMEDAKEFSEGQFTQTGDMKIDVNMPGMISGVLNGVFDIDMIAEGQAFALAGTMDFDGEYTIDENTEEVQLATAKGMKMNGLAKLAFGMTPERLYINPTEVDFTVNGDEEVVAEMNAAKAQFDMMKGMFVNKWFSMDVPADMQEELKKSASMNKEVMTLMSDIGTGLATADIFTEATEAEYEGEKAYKFAIDEKKANSYFYELAQEITTDHKQTLMSLGMMESDIESLLTDLKARAESDETSLDSEFYMTRANDGGVNIYMTKFQQEGEDYNLTGSIVENTLSIIGNNKESKTDLTLVHVDDNTVDFKLEGYDIIEDEEKKLITADGSYSSELKDDTLHDTFTATLNFAADENEPAFKNGLNLEIVANGETKKVTDLEITEATITDNAELITPLETMLGGMMGGMLAPAYSEDMDPFEGDMELDTEMEMMDVDGNTSTLDLEEVQLNEEPEANIETEEVLEGIMVPTE